MDERKIIRQYKVDALTEAFANAEYGTTLEHFRIAEIIGEKVNTQEYRQIVNRAKKDLIDSGKMIASVFGVGYRVVYPDEYVDQSAKCVVSGARQISKSSRILEHAPVKDMTQIGVQRYNTVNDRVNILQAAVCGAKVEIKMLAKKRDNPLSVMQ